MKKLNQAIQSFNAVSSRYEHTAAFSICNNSPAISNFNSFNTATPAKTKRQRHFPVQGCTTTPFSFKTPTDSL